MQKDTISQGTPSKMEGTSSNGIFYLTQATLGGLTLEGNHSGKQHLPLPDLGINNSINDYLLKHNPYKHLVS